jgi:hypothetical protein
MSLVQGNTWGHCNAQSCPPQAVSFISIAYEGAGSETPGNLLRVRESGHGTTHACRGGIAQAVAEVLPTFRHARPTYCPRHPAECGTGFRVKRDHKSSDLAPLRERDDFRRFRTTVEKADTAKGKYPLVPARAGISSIMAPPPYSRRAVVSSLGKGVLT